MRNSPEAQSKLRTSMQRHFGVDYAMQSPEVLTKAKDSLVKRYGHDNAMKVPDICARSHQSRSKNWADKVHLLLPMKQEPLGEYPSFPLNDSDLSIFVLKERASREFLLHYGFRISPKFAKKHFSVGLVKDGILYQVLRFEKVKTGLILADFGTRYGYRISNEYCKLMNYMTEWIDIDSFACEVPRGIASPEVIDSLQLTKISEGDYKVYWKIEDKLRKLTWRDDIEEMLRKYDYVTSDYLDLFEHN